MFLIISRFFRDRQQGVTFSAFWRFSEKHVQKSYPISQLTSIYQKSILFTLKSYIRRFKWATNEGTGFCEKKVTYLSKLTILGQKISKILYKFFYLAGGLENIWKLIKTLKAFFLCPNWRFESVFDMFWTISCKMKDPNLLN